MIRFQHALRRKTVERAICLQLISDDLLVKELQMKYLEAQP